jgi:hypothetical protein
MGIEAVRELARNSQQRAVEDAFARYTREYEQTPRSTLLERLSYLKNVAAMRERAVTALVRKGLVMDAQSRLFEAARAHAELRAAETALELAPA